MTDRREHFIETGAIELLTAAVNGACDTGGQTATSMAVISIAISLKRIADEVCGVPYDSAPGADNSRHHMGLVDGVMHAIEQGLLAASQRG